MMEINKKGFSLIEMVVVIIIIGIAIGTIISSIDNQIKKAKLQADLKIADKITSSVCPAYIKSFNKNNNWDNNDKINSHDFSIEHLQTLYKFKIPKNWNNPKLKYYNGLCILTFSFNSKNPPIINFKSFYKYTSNGNKTNIKLFYPIIDIQNGEYNYYNLTMKKLFNEGKIRNGTFDDKWDTGNNYNLLKNYSNTYKRNLNRTNKDNDNEHDLNSLSYKGKPIPKNMKFIY